MLCTIIVSAATAKSPSPWISVPRTPVHKASSVALFYTKETNISDTRKENLQKSFNECQYCKDEGKDPELQLIVPYFYLFRGDVLGVCGQVEIEGEVDRHGEVFE